MAKVFITGISGFVGRNVAIEAQSQGYEVSGIDIVGQKLDGIETIECDIRSPKVWNYMKGSDYVIHLAAVTSNVEFEKRMHDCYDINVTGFNNVIEAASKNGCKRFVYASSAAIYLDRFSEETIIDIRKQGNHYAKTKLINEMVAASYNDKGMLDAVGLRYFNIFGPGEDKKSAYASIVSRFIRMKKNREPLTVYGDGRQSRDFVYIKDVAKITVELLRKGDKGVYNVGTGVSTTYNDIAAMVGKDSVKHVKNPLSSYQLLTMSDNSKLNKLLGNYRFVTVKEGATLIESME